MTRLEQLTLNLADDALTDSEGRELQALLKESGEAGQMHIRILQVEAGLRVRRKDLDLVPPIMARLRIQLADSIARDVMSEIKAQPMPNWSQGAVLGTREERPGAKVLSFPFSRRRSRAALKPVLLALVACAAFVTGLWMFGPTMGEPTLAEVQGSGLSIVRAGQSLPAVAGMRLQSADILRTPANVTAIIGFPPEATRVTLEPGSELKLTGMSRGKRFDLRLGKLEASVARQRPFQPMVITTPQAEARVVGTRFALVVTTNVTRLDVTEGKVKFTRKSDDASVKVEAGRYAVATANYELAALPFTGNILREYWSSVTGQTIANLQSDPRYPAHPDGSDLSPTFEWQPVKTNHLGVRVCGYVHPPVTGDYEFWLAGTAGAALYMSPSENPVEKVPIAQIIDSSKKFDRPRFLGGTPWAPPVQLVAGHRYYIEALVFIEKGEGHLSVAWKRPGASRELLTGEYLSPFKPK